MMRHILAFLALCVLFNAPSSSAFLHRGSSSARSELVLQSPGSGEYPFLNSFKEAFSNWTYSDNSGIAKPDELDSNGYLLPGGSWSSTHSGAKTTIPTPSQSERPGHYVFIWTGQASFRIAQNSNGQIGAPATAYTGCNGSVFGQGLACDNTGCSTFTGSIAVTTLTVTAAPTGTGCSLGAGVPITGSGVKISAFGTPTIITSAGSTCGSNTCYTVNQSQTIASETMQAGGRVEWSTTTPAQTTTLDQYVIQEISAATNYAANMGLVFNGAGGPGAGDETLYWNSATPCGSGKGCIVGALFKTRIKQGNFAVLRDLDWSASNTSNCATWASRKPTTYAFYGVNEFRNAASGNATYVAGGHTYTVPIAGQYVNAAGTGASGGTVSYNAGTDVYSITLGSGGPVDKQTIIMLSPATGTTASKISLNGATASQIVTPFGFSTAAFSSFIPQNGGLTTLTYDATIGSFMSWGGSTIGDRGLTCPVPPEVFIEINAELGTIPWQAFGQMSVDPMTDWVTQDATYVKANYPSVKPRFEAANEPWNCTGGPYIPWYFSTKSSIYIAQDTNGAWQTGLHCSSTGNYNSEIGKIVSTIGQDLNVVYGQGNYDFLDPIFTAFGGAGSFNDVLLSAAYIGQSMPAQTGYSQTAAYTYANHLSLNNYWNTGDYQSAAEVALGYCYFNYSISATCQGLYASQAAVMTAYMNTSSTSVASLITQFQQWQTFAATCASGSRPSNCAMDQVTPLEFYEGGFQNVPPTQDFAQSFTSATNASSAVLAITGNGCVVGQAVALSGLSGGTWPSAAGSYSVTAVPDANHCTINLNSTSLGSLSGATLTYTGSTGYVTNIIQAAYLSPEMDTSTTSVYNAVIANGGFNPSQYHLAGAAGSNPWLLWAFDIYGYFPIGTCSSCTIASSTLTLGGTITGTFRVGDTLFGGNGVTGLGTGAASNTTITSCTKVGAGPCGTNSGDTLGLSQASTASGIPMSSNATPPVNSAGNSTTSPVRQWGAVCRWNNNGSQCNG